MQIYRGIIKSVSDPESRGRVMVTVAGFQNGANLTQWCNLCMPFAGNGYGFFFLPQAGDEVFLTPAQDGSWIVLGLHWSETNQKPAEGSADVRVLKTPAGHKIEFDESGDITITSSGNAEAKIKASGDITLNGDSGGGVVTKKCICAFTGNEHPQSSTTVKGKGAF